MENKYNNLSPLLAFCEQSLCRAQVTTGRDLQLPFALTS
jgi:hypothetical protein